MAVTTVLFGCDTSGATANRPSNAPDGFCYFDTDLGLPIWRDNTNDRWVDALGNDVDLGVRIIVGDGAPSDSNTNGSGLDLAQTGSLYVDYSTPALYQNMGYSTAPNWDLVGPQTT